MSRRFVLSCWFILTLFSLALADSRLEEAQALFTSGRHYEAAALLEELRSSDPENLEVALLLLRVLASAERHDEALSLAETFLAVQPENPDLLSAKAVSLFELGKSPQARQAIDRALTLHPDNPKLLYNSAFFRIGSEEEMTDEQGTLAKSELDRLIETSPSAGAYRLRAMLKSRYLHQPSAALTDLDQAIALEPENGATYFSRGLLLQEMDRLEQAIEDLEKAVRRGTLLQESWVYFANETLIRLKYPPDSPGAILHSETYFAGSLAEALPTPSVKELKNWPGPGILVTPTGLLASQETGFGFTPWELISAVRVDGNGVVLLVGDLTHEKTLVFQTGPTYSTPSYQGEKVSFEEVTHDRPYLLDAAEFEQLVVRSAGLSLHEQEGEHRLYGKSTKTGVPPREAIFIPMRDSLKEKTYGWSPEHLSTLRDQPGLTINQVGIAYVTPHKIYSTRWDEVGSIDTEGSELRIYGGHHRNSIVVSMGGYFLQPQDLVEAALLLGGEQKNFEDDKFYPLLVLDAQYTDALALTLWQPDVTAEPGQFELWPSGLQAEGLYVTPRGISEADLYTIHLAPWESITQLMEGSLGWITFNEITLTPRNNQELAAFVAFRRDIAQGAGLQATGLNSTPYERGASPPTPVKESRRFALSEESTWKGLPFSVLGESPREPGLYLLPEGLMSVSESRLDLVPWADISMISVASSYDSSTASRMKVRAPDYEGDFPPNGDSLKLTADELLKTLNRYVELDSEGEVVKVLSSADAAFLRYEKAP